MKKFYITTAIDYVNSKPHLGTAYEKIGADVIARYMRLKGVETFLLMGNDEHSLNVQRSAEKSGLDPMEYCDQMEVDFRAVWDSLNISYDGFVRTTDRNHELSVTRFIERIAEVGDIYEGFYEGWYCVSCEAFKQEKDLVEGACPTHRIKPSWIKEKNYFFRLSKYQKPLLDYYRSRSSFLEPEIRRNEILRVLESGLEDISISRAGQSWGIPLPKVAGSVVYVWFDALISYMTGVGFEHDTESFEHWWPADLHIIGKDITRFHSIIWPSMLMSAKISIPEKVFGHGWINHRGEKMSKSLGTSVDPLDAVDRFGADPLRLYLVREIVWGNDGDFSWDRFKDRYNSDLANNLGNLVNRVTSMGVRYRDGHLSGPSGSGKLASICESKLGEYCTAMDHHALQGGSNAAFGIIDSINEFINETEPWALSRDASRVDRLNQVLYDTAEALRIATLLLIPIIPNSCGEIFRRLGVSQEISNVRLAKDAVWGALGDRRVVSGSPIWPRLDR